MLASSTRRNNPSGISWSLLFLFAISFSGTRAYLNKHPVLDSDILALFGSDPCIPGSLMAMPQSVPMSVSQPQVQENLVSSSEIPKGTIIEELAPTIEQSMAKEKTPMCLVNELARHNKIDHQYRLTGEEGPAHKKRFNVTLRLGTEEYNAEGPSIKKAQHSAASVALQQTSYRHPPPKNLKHQNRQGKGNITPTVELNALAMKRGEPTVYTMVEIPSTPPHNFNNYHRGMYTQAYNEPYYQYNSNYRGKTNYRYPNARNQRNFQPPQSNATPPPNVKGYKVKVKVGDREFYGEGSTSQSARHDAASKALDTLRELPVNPVTTVIQQSCTDNCIEADSSSELKSPISLVHEIALKRNMTVSFDVISEKGPPHMRTFVTKCTVGDQFEVNAEGNGKKISKKRAAEKMLELLRTLPPVPPTAISTNPSKMKRKGTQSKKKPRNLIKDTKPSTENVQPREEKQDGDGSSDDMNPISRLIQIQQAKKEKEPVYVLKEERGAPRRREFLIQASVGNTFYVGSGPNKKIAKRNAAEGLLQLLGYSSPTVDREGVPITPSLSSDIPPASNPGGPKGRQIVPGLLLMNNDKTASSTNPHSGVSLKTTAAVAKEYLNSQAAAAKENEESTIRPSEQLDYLAQILNFKVQYSDFKKNNRNDFLSLVSLSTDPPLVCHGSGPNTDISKDQAALNALRSVADIGLDSITTTNKKPLEPPLTTNVTLNTAGLNTSSTVHDMYMGMGNTLTEDNYLNGK